MNLVVIYGPPASGKLTVAQELSAITGYKLFHNHLTVNAVAALFEFGTPEFTRLTQPMRSSLDTRRRWRTKYGRGAAKFCSSTSLPQSRRWSHVSRFRHASITGSSRISFDSENCSVTGTGTLYMTPTCPSTTLPFQPKRLQSGSCPTSAFLHRVTRHEDGSCRHLQPRLAERVCNHRHRHQEGSRPPRSPHRTHRLHFGARDGGKRGKSTSR